MNKIVMQLDKPCKHSIRFSTSDDKAPIQNVYVSRSVPGVNAAKTVTITLTVDGAASQVSSEDAALLEAIK